MASTTQTTNYGLPLYQSSDRPAWTDTNTPFESLDTAVKTASDNASSAADAVSTLTTSLATLNQTVSGHTTELSTLTSAVASAATAQGTSFTAHGLNTATDAQTAIQNAATAAINSYDNTDSGLTAANVQAAIDELVDGTQYETIASVTGDGTQTAAQLFTSLYSQLSAYLTDIDANPGKYVLYDGTGTLAVLTEPASAFLTFNQCATTSSQWFSRTYKLGDASTSAYTFASITSSGATFTDSTSTTPSGTFAIARRKY